mmetsp:Transcript_31440/g.74985  ORF Transcript_31440/g.74985 Transcript_31440/m.74985 type:complete len:224 (-) Transcript_31440:107-778(-)
MGASQCCVFEGGGTSTTTSAVSTTLTTEVVEDSEAAVRRLRKQLPDKPIVCIVGGTSFQNPISEALVTNLGAALRRLPAVFVTGGLQGVQERFAASCNDSSSHLFHLLPFGQHSDFAHGSDLHAGRDLDERKDVFGKLGDLYITVEGGPGVAKEAATASQRKAAVIPLICTGGASSGLFDFPKQCLERPTWAPEHLWGRLRKADPTQAAQAVADLAQIFLERR